MADSGGGETREGGLSGWTIDTLYAHLHTRLTDLQAMLNERYATQTKAVDAAFIAQQTAMQTALAAAEAAVTKALESAEKAVIKAENAADKRFESVNEFRSQLAFQATTFMPRTECEAAIERNSERIAEVQDRLPGLITRDEALAVGDRNNARIQDFADRLTGVIGLLGEQLPRAEYATMHGALTQRVQELADRLNKAEGSTGGAAANRSTIVSFIGAGTAIIAILITVYVTFKGP